MIFPNITEAAVWAIYASPIASFLLIVLVLRGRHRYASCLTVAAVGLSWLLTLWAVDTSIGLDGQAIGFEPHTWLSLFELEVSFGIRLDGLTAIMLLVVTSVSLLVQIYSMGYMHGDSGYSRYFAYMSLFTAAMLGLVLSSNLVQLFAHWELVGLSSYLLIGFWFDRPAAAAAAKKAFIVTRLGDFGFLLAILLIWSKTGEFDIAAINALSGALPAAVVTGFTLGVLAGAVGKSAQFPLHIWLPDAMEGPTPVSALIHAATMVVAGVYLIARFFPSFEAAPQEVRDIVAYIGGFTALLAATIAIVMTDIKRVLAYSTISQLGYMVMTLGLGGYVGAIFHLFTHAFFKALLFLGAGSVNHATQTFDMRRMGGLRSTMPVTFVTFLVAAFSLAGVFPLSGFWSKDEILLDALKHDQLLFVIGMMVASMTAFYMARVVFLVFFGQYRGGQETSSGQGDQGTAMASGMPHESPPSMRWPLIILAVPAAVIGWVNIGGDFGVFVEGALPGDVRHFESQIHIPLMVFSTVFALSGIGVASAIYYYRHPMAVRMLTAVGPVHTLIERKYFMDELAETVFVRCLLNGVVGRSLQTFDTYVVDAAVDAVGIATRLAGDAVRRSENGQLQAYTSLFFAGLIVVAAMMFATNGNVLER